MSHWGTCEKCGHGLEMYYRKFCPMCDKPEVEDMGKKGKCINILEVLYYMEARYPGFKEKFWDWFIEAYDFRNDTIIQFDIDHLKEEDVEDLTYDERLVKVGLWRVKREFGLKDCNVYLEISW